MNEDIWFYYVLFCFCVGLFARFHRNRSFFFWALGAAMLSPIVAGVILLLVGPAWVKTPDEQR